MSIINPNAKVLDAKDYQDVSLGDKVKMGFKQGALWRNYTLKDTLITTAGVGTAVGTAAAVAKSKTAQNAIMKVVNGAKNSEFSKEAIKTLKSASSNKYIQGAVKWVKGLPTPAKVAGASILALTGLISSINKNKALEKSGALVQQYIDANKAKKNISE